MDAQYDVSEKVRALYEIKKKQRQEAKFYFAKYMESPHRPIGDYPPFDPLLFRSSAQDALSYKFYKVTPKNALFSLCFYFGPSILLTAYVMNHYNKREETFRSGVVAYKDRKYLNIY